MSNTSIGALTGTAGGTNIPLADCSTSATEIVVLGRDPSGSNATPYRAIPISSLPVGLTEFQHILTSRADLVAVVAPVGGVFVLPAGSYFVKNSFALNAGEGMQINNTSVFLMGGGPGMAITGGSATIPLLQVTGAAGRAQLLDLTLNAAVANVRILEAGGEVSTAQQCVFSQTFASATEPAVTTVGTGRLTLDLCRITAVNRCLRHSAASQRVTVIGSRIESEQGTAVEVDAANSWMLITGSIVRTTLGNTGQCFFLNAAGASIFVTDSEVATFGTANLVLISAAGIAALNISGGEWQCGSAVATIGINITGPITKELDVHAVAVQNCAIWVNHGSGTVAAAKVFACTGTVGVTTCIQWLVANIPTRGLIESQNQWNAATASVFTNHQQNDARVMRRMNHSSTAPMSETGIVP
jgi:hypothetical protein